jgi:hypothetical protein
VKRPEHGLFTAISFTAISAAASPGALAGYVMRMHGNPSERGAFALRGRLDPSAAGRTAEERGETLDQVLDRNVAELLQELRVALTGVQILFAFLLSLAFTQRFEQLDGVDLAVYTVALLSTALATMVLIAPVSFHRLLFRQRQKAALVVVANRLLVAGLAMVMVAITCSVLLILDVVLGRWPAIVGSSATALVGLFTWYVLPLAIRRSGPGPAPPRPGVGRDEV